MNEKIQLPGNAQDQGPTYAVEAQLTPRHEDGSVIGSYPAETMQNLLRYRPEHGGAIALNGVNIEAIA
jgi:hypothetical protein